MKERKATVTEAHFKVKTNPQKYSVLQDTLTVHQLLFHTHSFEVPIDINP
jgi:hypothetical protein